MGTLKQVDAVDSEGSRLAVPSREEEAAIVYVHGGCDYQAAIAHAGLKAIEIDRPDEVLVMSPTQVPSCLLLRTTVFTGLVGMQVRIRRYRSDLPTVCLGPDTDLRGAICLMKAGAFDVLQEPVSRCDLIATLGAALRLSGRTAGQIRQLAILQARLQTLSAREREVMRLIVYGYLNKQVAAELGIREVTVKVHRGSVMRKMKAKSFADLVRMGDALDMDDPPLRSNRSPGMAAPGCRSDSRSTFSLYEQNRACTR